MHWAPLETGGSLSKATFQIAWYTNPKNSTATDPANGLSQS